MLQKYKKKIGYDKENKQNVSKYGDFLLTLH